MPAKDLYGVYGALDAYGTGGTPLDAAEDAWVNFPGRTAGC